MGLLGHGQGAERSQVRPLKPISALRALTGDKEE